jgi:hypothetical protein
VSLSVVGLHLGEPGGDLAHPEAKLTADPEPPRAAALAAQVVKGLHADTELDGELREGDDGIEPALRGWAMGGRALCCGLHTAQVRQSCRPRSRGVQTTRDPRPVRRPSADFWVPARALGTTFGRRPMGKILPSEIQRWVTTATEHGLSAASVGKYHTMLHSVFERALRDRVVTFNPCAHTELPKKVKKKARTLTPDEYDAILAALPAQHRLRWRPPSTPACGGASSSRSNPATSISPRGT